MVDKVRKIVLEVVIYSGGYINSMSNCSYGKISRH